MMNTSDKIVAFAFSTPRDPRSAEYKEGMRVVLAFRLGEISEVRCPFPLGTAQADAFFSGCDEGHRRFREHQEGGAA